MWTREDTRGLFYLPHGAKCASAELVEKAEVLVSDFPVANSCLLLALLNGWTAEWKGERVWLSIGKTSTLEANFHTITRRGLEDVEDGGSRSKRQAHLGKVCFTEGLQGLVGDLAVDK